MRYSCANSTLVEYYLFRLDLAQYIRELILLNECVILPGFGGFETQYEAAQYDKANKRMLPPTKKVVFREDYVKGGGILEDHLCRHLKIQNEQAAQYITEYIQELTKRINSNREVIINGVGLFTKGLGNNLTFTPFDKENYLAESFGLEALPFERKEVEFEQEQKREFKIRPRSNTLIFVILGVIIISILLAITVFISSKFDLYIFNIGDNEVQSDLIILGDKYSSDSTFQNINSLLASTDLKSALNYNETESQSSNQLSDVFYLVAGSFRVRKNAEIIRDDLVKEGYMPEIIEDRGFYRVSIGNFSDKQTALQELKRLRRQLDRSVWLLSVH